MKYGPWACTHCMGDPKGCEHCSEGFVRCERPDCAFEAIIEKHGDRLCALCAKDKKGMVTVG